MANSLTCIDGEGNTETVLTTELRWRPSAYALIIQNDKLLVSPQYNGIDLPGGGIELGELPEDGLIREVFEETGITVKNPVLLSAGSSFYKLPYSEKGRYIQSILLFYACTYVEGQLSDSNFTVEDKKFSKFPEWLSINDFDMRLQKDGRASSFDWTPLVKGIIGRRSSVK